MKSKLIFFASRGACILSKNQFYISQRFISYNALKSDIYNSKKITSSLAANNFVTNLCHDEREHLKKALLNIEQKNSLEKEATPEPSPSWKQLQLVAISNGIPFIGFGFIDNSIMILAGEYIDLKLGVIFGMSTMTAAAIGNMVSDVSGIIWLHRSCSSTIWNSGTNFDRNSELNETNKDNNICRPNGRRHSWVHFGNVSTSF
ncbi:transmembrane protein 65 isoform X2 [Hydra vulgaris]|uniref:transmembrane protein 65 isoform X2 n=1 Tax=Hydra vulgaris TaxID=6087 RepID=UPI001F5F5289|nr:transmembrane protein 65 isoform X2 [Hydra vulgaris]